MDFWIRIKIACAAYSSDRVRADHSDSLRERYAMWKNVDLEAWYRSRFIGFTDLSPRSDTGFGLVFSGINWQDNWMSFFSRMRWKVDEMMACRKVFVQTVYTWDTYFCMLSSKIFLYSYFHFCHQQGKRNLVTRNSKPASIKVLKFALIIGPSCVQLHSHCCEICRTWLTRQISQQ